MKFPKLLRKRRVTLGLSQVDLEKELGMCPATITRYENGRLMPGCIMLMRLAFVLGRVKLEVMTAEEEHVQTSWVLLDGLLGDLFGEESNSETTTK